MTNNNKVAIVTDSVACIPKERVEEYGIEVVPIQVVFGDKVYRDGVDITPREFYAMLRKAEKLPTTASAIPGAVLEAYQKASQRSDSILCVTISSKLSGMFEAAQLAKEMAKEELPDVTIELLDSEIAAAAQGLIVLEAAKAAASGKSLSEVVETAKNVRQRVHLLIMLDTLYYLAKGGHVPKVAALAGSIIKIKPLLTFKEGEAEPIANPRTNSKAIERILQLMEQWMVKGEPLHVAVTHADVEDEAIKLRDRIASQYDCADLFITEFTPVMGAHTGPGVIGICFFSGS